MVQTGQCLIKDFASFGRVAFADRIFHSLARRRKRHLIKLPSLAVVAIAQNHFFSQKKAVLIEPLQEVETVRERFQAMLELSKAYMDLHVQFLSEKSYQRFRAIQQRDTGI